MSFSLMILLAFCLPECIFPVALLHGKLSWAAQENGNTRPLQSTMWPQQKLPLTPKNKVPSQALLCAQATTTTLVLLSPHAGEKGCDG